MHIITFFVALALLSVLTTVLPQCSAQSAPLSVNPGALLNYNQGLFFMSRTMPFLYRPILQSDLKPVPVESSIKIEDGVLPGASQSVQGIVKTDTSTYITGPQQDKE
jgi:hypothetical protein